MSDTAEPEAAGIQLPARRRGYRLTAAVLLIMMLGGTLPVPLYVLYEKQMGFGPLGVTVVFAAYVLGTLVALVLFGDLSDHIGRRRVLAIAVVCAAVSTGLFLAATGIGLLIVARVVSGTAAGFATGTATAGLAELQPRGDHQAAAVVASGANMTGLGLGPLVAGLFAAYVAMPLHSVFWAYLGACALALAAVAVIPETVRHPDRRVSFRPRMAVPAGMGAVMLGACLGVFAAFSVLGLFSSLVPTFLHGVLGVHNLALIGGGSFLIFVTAAISQAALRPAAGPPQRERRCAAAPGVPGRAGGSAVRHGVVAVPDRHDRRRHRCGLHLPRRSQRAEPARRTAAPGGRRVHVLRCRVCRPGPAGRADRPHLAGGGPGGRERLRLVPGRGHRGGRVHRGAARLRPGHRAQPARHPV